MTIKAEQMRRVHPALAFLAGLVGLGMGYVYVGRIRAGIVAVFSYFLIVGLFSWTRVLVYSALACWLLAALGVLLLGVTLIHPSILAVRKRPIPRRWYNRVWFYGLWIIAVTVMASSVVRYRATIFGYEPFRIPSASMTPTVLVGDFVMADTWRYQNHAAAPGDIVIVEQSEDSGIKYIKRVVGVAGDTIEIRDGILYRNGLRTDEPYIHEPSTGGGYGRNIPLVKVEAGSIYVLGDYRDNSVDSRRWGLLPTSSLRGRAQYIWLSMSGSKVRWDRVGISLIH